MSNFVVDNFVRIVCVLCRRCGKQSLWSTACLVFRVLQLFTRWSWFARRVLYVAESTVAWPCAEVSKLFQCATTLKKRKKSCFLDIEKKR